MLFYKNKNVSKKFILLLWGAGMAGLSSLMANPLGSSISGYSFCVGGSIIRHKTTPTFDTGAFVDFDGKHLHKQFTENKFGVVFTAEYMYSIFHSFSLAGQVYFGIDGANQALHDKWEIKKDKNTFTAQSTLDLRGRYRFGWNLLGGVKISTVLLYGTFGFQVRLMQMRGALSVTNEKVQDQTAVIFFGKEETKLNGVKFEKLQPLHKIVWSPTFGLGTRFYFLGNRVFVDLAGSYTYRSRKMKMKYALYNNFEKELSFGEYSDKTNERNDRLEPSFKISGWRATLSVGVRL